MFYRMILVIGFGLAVGYVHADAPGPIAQGFLLPSGWKITPVGKVLPTPDSILNIVRAPDGKSMIALTSGFNQHEVVNVDLATESVAQEVPLPTTWLGLAWAPDGSRLYVSGGNNKREKTRAPIYVLNYKDGKVDAAPVALFNEDLPGQKIYWSGLVCHPTKKILFAANRSNNEIAVFDTETGKITAHIPTEVNPYTLVLSKDASTLYCSNWGSDSVSVIDTESMQVKGVIPVGDNPNDLALTKDGRLFVCCSNDNTVVVIDTNKGRATEKIYTSLYPNSPEGSTPNALALDEDEDTLYVANADNNDVCIVDIDEPGETTVRGFIPAGWYPSSLALSPDGKKLYIGNSEGVASFPDPNEPNQPNPPKFKLRPESVKTLRKGAISIIDLPITPEQQRKYTLQVYKNCPYNNDLMTAARPSAQPTVVPNHSGAACAIKHCIYIIKENRTYDQVLGDDPRGNGDPSLTIFGKEVTPNIHKMAEQFVLFDNLYCNAEVSYDGHQWSNGAYATDFTEKYWPASYGGKSDAPMSPAVIPNSGYLWDQCAKKGLTYRSYGEFAQRVSDKGPMQARKEGPGNLAGHVSPNYFGWGGTDTENAEAFIQEFDGYEKNYDAKDPAKRLPNYIVMCLPHDHTKGTKEGELTPRAFAGENDHGLGMIVERVSHSKYWPETAIFVIEDDAQDGPDHVDARRTEGLLISPYVRRGLVDHTLYTTCSMLRTMELILGLHPMSQYDAAATPMFASLGDKPDLTPYDLVAPTWDLTEKNGKKSFGANESAKMNFAELDEAPMFELNEILWKSIKGENSAMPLPTHRFHVGKVQ